jgi:hypothetical protein
VVSCGSAYGLRPGLSIRITGSRSSTHSALLQTLATRAQHKKSKTVSSFWHRPQPQAEYSTSFGSLASRVNWQLSCLLIAYCVLPTITNCMLCLLLEDHKQSTAPSDQPANFYFRFRAESSASPWDPCFLLGCEHLSPLG